MKPKHGRELEAKSAENLDGWQRAVAEFQNYKKRIDRDRESDKAIMKGDLIKKVLPVWTTWNAPCKTVRRKMPGPAASS